MDDMLINRADRTINICEMKFWNSPYAMTAKDEDDIERKVQAFIETTNTDKNVIVTRKSQIALSFTRIALSFQKISREFLKKSMSFFARDFFCVKK